MDFYGPHAPNGILLFPERLGGGLQVFPPILLKGPTHDRSVLVEGIIRHLLLVDGSDLLYIFRIEIRELGDRSGF